MTDDWLRCRQDKGCAALLDFRAAFDIFDLILLFAKGNGVTRPAGGKECLVMSDSKELCCGLPQGSCLSPILYSVFTNDLPLVLNNATVAMHVDYCTMYSAATTDFELSEILSIELKKVGDWVHKYKQRVKYL